jgi:hypothetical protein
MKFIKAGLNGFTNLNISKRKESLNNAFYYIVYTPLPQTTFGIIFRTQNVQFFRSQFLSEGTAFMYMRRDCS